MFLSYLKYTLRRPALKFAMTTGRLLYRLLDRKPEKGRIKKILVIQFGGIGDVIRIFPSIQVLHHEFPQATITAVTEYDDKIFDLFPGKATITNFVQLDPRGRHRSFFSKLKMINTLRNEGFDLIFQPGYGYGMMEFSIISFLIGSPCRIGFMKDGAGFLNTTKNELRIDRSIIKQQLDLLSEAGIYDIHYRPEYFLHIRKEDMDYAARFYQNHGLANRGPVVTIHPWAKWETKGRCWSVERYIELIKKLIQNYKANILVLGSKEEMWVAKKIRQEAGEQVIITAGQTTLGQTSAIVSSSNLFVGNDSGLLHIAIGCAVPSVGIFGFTSSRQVIHSNSSCMAVEKTLPCRPCYYHQPFFKFTCDHTECLSRITVEDVLKAVEMKLHGIRVSGNIPDTVHKLSQTCGDRE